MAKAKKAKLDFEFVIPVDQILEQARDMLGSDDQDQKDVGKAVLDTTAITVRTRDMIASGGKCDLAPYFDHWLGDAVESAQRLLAAQDSRVRNVADTLLAQSKAIVRSKECFLKESKRVQG